MPQFAPHMQAMADIPPQPWPTGKAEQLEPLVRRVLAPNPSPYTYTGTQTYVVGGPEGVAVIDPGPDDPAHLAAILETVGSAPMRAIMCTHTHRDHSPAAAPLAAATGAPVVGCAPIAGAVDVEGFRADEAFDLAYAPDRALADGEAMTGPGWTLRAVHTPGHVSNHLCYALEESGALFTGDHVMGWSTSVVIPPDGDMGDYMRSLDKLQQRDERVYYPAHGAQVDKPRQLVRGMIGHRRQRENQILRLLSEGRQSIAGGLVPQMYKGLDARLVKAAGMSVLAHLIDLEKRGMAGREGECWVAARAIAP